MSEFWAVVGRSVIDANYFNLVKQEAKRGEGAQIALTDWLSKSDSNGGGGPFRLSRVDIADLLHIFTQDNAAHAEKLRSFWPTDDRGLPDLRFQVTDMGAMRQSVELCAVVGLLSIDLTYLDEILAAANKSEDQLREFLSTRPMFFVDNAGVKALRTMLTKDPEGLRAAANAWEAEAWRKPETPALGKCSRGFRIRTLDEDGNVKVLPFLHIPQPELERLIEQNPQVFIQAMNRSGNPGVIFVQ